MSEERVEELLSELDTVLRELVSELEDKVGVIYLDVAHWTQRYPVYKKRHGFEITRYDYESIHELIRDLLNLAEIEFDNFKIYATIEDGVTVWGYRSVENVYGRTVGTQYFIMSLAELIKLAREKAKAFDVSKLKTSLEKLLAEISG